MTLRLALLSVPPVALLLRSALSLSLESLASRSASLSSQRLSAMALFALVLTLSGCVSTPASPASKTEATERRQPSAPPAHNTEGADRAGHSMATAVAFTGISNPLAFSQKQQEWLWLHYRDWKKQSQALREKNGVRYDEVTLINRRGDKRVIYFRMPNTAR